MPWAAAIPAVIGAAGSIAGGLMGGGDSGATDAMVEAQEAAAKLAKQQGRDNMSYQYPWYTGGVAAQNTLLNLLGLGSAETANTQAGTAGRYLDPALLMMEAARIRQDIQEQLKGQGGAQYDQLERQLTQLQAKYARLAGKDNPNDAQLEALEQQIMDVVAAMDAGQAAQATGYQLGELGTKIKPLLNKMTDLEVVRTFGEGGKYGRPGTAAAGTATEGPTDAESLKQAALSKFTTDPGYLFRLQEQEKAMLRSAAATGGAQSGSTLKALSRFNQDYASNEYANWYNRLANMAGQGGTQANSLGVMGYNTAGQVGQALTNAGAARASGYTQQADQRAQMMNSLASGVGQLAGGLSKINWGGDFIKPQYGVSPLNL